MPASPFQDQDPFDPETQRLADETERKIYGPTGGVCTDRNIKPLFFDAFDRPANCALAHDILKTDRWGMKGSMVALADVLGTDHGAISRWYHKGELSPALWRFLMFCPTRPADWFVPVEKERNACHRAGCLAVAKYLFGRLPGHRACDGESLRELQAELLFEMFHEGDGWREARAAQDYTSASRIVCAVCDEGEREILPFWYITKQRKEIERVIERLHGDARFAFKYLCRLQRHWEGVFALTWMAVEGIGWM